MMPKILKLNATLLKDFLPKSSRRLLSSARLEPIGILEPSFSNKQYETGQLFLHKVFGYRGIVISHWHVKMYDRDETPSCRLARHKNSNSESSVKPQLDSTSNLSTKFGDSEESSDANKHLNLLKNQSKKDESGASLGSSPDSGATSSPKSVPQSRTCLYYTVLMDQRDWRHVKYRTQTEGVTFLHESEENSPFFTIPGLDYVSHDDVMPYSTLSVKPIQHNLLDKFISYEPTTEPPFVARHALKDWTRRNRFWLEPTDVYKETTNDIRVTVIPFYMGCKRKRDPNNSPSTVTASFGDTVQQYWWRYCIRLENVGTQNVQLCERNWRIFSMNGSLETVRARGVNGVEPLLSMDMPAFQYSSHVSLYTPSGHMWGTFRIRSRSGKSFDVKVPPFTLECKSGGGGGTSNNEDGTHSAQ